MISFKLKIINSEKFIFQNFVKKVSASCVEGDLDIYPNHCKFLTYIDKPSIIYIINDNFKNEYIYISSGILEKYKNNLLILSDDAINSNELDELSLIKEKKNIENIKNDTKNYNINNINLLKIEKKLKIIYLLKNK